MQFLISELRLHEIESTGFGINGLNQLRALWELHLRKKMPSCRPLRPSYPAPCSPVVRNLVTAVPPLLSPPKRRQKVVSADGKTERGTTHEAAEGAREGMRRPTANQGVRGH